MADRQETLYAMALSLVGYSSLTMMHELIMQMESATAVVEQAATLRQHFPGLPQRLLEGLTNMTEPLRRAEDELRWDEKHGIQAIPISDDRYPQRLRDCNDAPLVLYYRGSATINAQKVIAVVGTRHCTPYGEDVVARLSKELASLCPDALVVSGLAYGIDIRAHRGALSNGLDTIGVLAHGLDTLYPSAHRDTARQMVTQGGLITEFMSGTRPEKMNFVRRNRIIAGLADATLVVESAVKGGGLITCRIANSYDRPVFAIPGAVTAPFSEGCNQLIRDNIAALITSAADLVKAMNWETSTRLKAARQQGIERQLFPLLNTEEQKVTGMLAQRGDMQLNVLAVQSGVAIAQLTAMVQKLEIMGVVRNMAGGMVHLIR